LKEKTAVIVFDDAKADVNALKRNGSCWISVSAKTLRFSRQSAQSSSQRHRLSFSCLPGRRSDNQESVIMPASEARLSLELNAAREH